MKPHGKRSELPNKQRLLFFLGVNMSNKEEILRYIFMCVSYKHMFDLSPRITDNAQKKEDLLFSSAVYFLRELYKNKNVFVEYIE